MAEAARAYVSIGSNVDRERSVRRAVELLAARFSPLDVSSVYESEAVGFAGDPFLNLVVGFDTDLAVERLAAELRAIEDACGRVRRGGGIGPRTMDIDLLLYGDVVRRDVAPELPRPEIARYAFVLRPLAEIAGARRHPLSGRTFAEMWSAFDRAAQPTRRVDLALAACAAGGRE